MAKAKKSAHVKLTPDQVQELKDAIISGESPKSIHERLGVSIANIGYHKGELKKKGLLNSASAKKATTPKPATVKKAKTAPKKASTSEAKAPPKKEVFKLIVNGVSVHIEGAGSVSVGEGYIKVDF